MNEDFRSTPNDPIEPGLEDLDVEGLHGPDRIRRMADYVWDDPQAAGKWLECPHVLLNAKTPLAEAETDEGVVRVERILYNIFYGLPV